MKVLIAYLDVKPECIEQFKEITIYNHENARKEAGNIRFDVIQDVDDPTKFALYEAYTDEEAFAFHKTTEHYNKWAATVADYCVKPRTRTNYTPIAFG